MPNGIVILNINFYNSKLNITIIITIEKKIVNTTSFSELNLYSFTKANNKTSFV